MDSGLAEALRLGTSLEMENIWASDEPILACHLPIVVLLLGEPSVDEREQVKLINGTHESIY